ncbi:MAG: UDP-N-acetylmuramoyl-L-alanine--D-glutamate ligase [Alphaproteobacteria bacterium]|nr:UDP-N-acetylmuramoyl-L-alanine--D-glutamate ligase [Alphaproteobacteria bacterium]
MTIALSQFRDRPVGVLGLAKSGRATMAALKAGGARGLGWDDGEAARVATQSEGGNIAPPETWPWPTLAALVPSPGIPASHPLFARAAAERVEVVGDVELLWRVQPEAGYVGITGTNGKSTTTALIAHVLKRAGLEVEVGGNLGTPALALAPLGRKGHYVLELSSFQLDLTLRMSLDVAVLLNITPDHLDRHGGMAGYLAAKKKIFRAGRLRTAIVGVDDEPSREIAAELSRDAVLEVVPVSIDRAPARGVGIIDAVIHEDRRPVLDLRAARALPGRHNWQNAGAAFAAARALGLDPNAIGPGIQSFPGLAHRIETISVIDGVRYINDSKATNADAAARALDCFDAIYWIAGGRPKAGGINSLRPYFKRIAKAYLIGEAEAEFAATLDGAVPYRRCGTLAAALSAAREDARAEKRPSPVVLLSPACASYDQFANFEARGEAFRRLVQEFASHRGPSSDTRPDLSRRAAP